MRYEAVTIVHLPLGKEYVRNARPQSKRDLRDLHLTRLLRAIGMYLRPAGRPRRFCYHAIAYHLGKLTT